MFARPGLPWGGHGPITPFPILPGAVTVAPNFRQADLSKLICSIKGKAYLRPCLRRLLKRVR
jgi:hypothetical protein